MSGLSTINQPENCTSSCSLCTKHFWIGKKTQYPSVILYCISSGHIHYLSHKCTVMPVTDQILYIFLFRQAEREDAENNIWGSLAWSKKAFYTSWVTHIVTVHQIAKYKVSTTAKTIEINRQKLLLLILFKQQVGFEMEETEWPRTPFWPANKHLYTHQH